jgi:hypothetical protein
MGGEFAASRLFHHHVEFDLAVVLTRGSGGSHSSDHAAVVDDTQQPVTESAAWDHNWRSTAVTIGANLKVPVESLDLRQRIRHFARARLREPAPDAFLAEVRAAESDY